MSEKSILFVVTSADKLDQKHSTGVWLEEFATPYFALKEKNYKITIASPKGECAPVDKASISNFSADKSCLALDILSKTEKLNTINPENYDAIILPGGHGPMIDLYKDRALEKILLYFDTNNLIIAAICHGPAGLLSCTLDGGHPFVQGRRLTAFTNEEEKLAQKDKLVHFLLEDKLKSRGANFVKNTPQKEHVIVDGNLITGQNFQSSELFARTILELL